ncbi:unnamed protein product [Diatraea saccharalis]|uniref:Uncharacterized protein n=1 Tax=Diatraea saccharalis TaxID=40085 RepID=A0A9P0G0X1_9NEOP|nr:unnamed protein product [Diatraea saccharalis]
MAKLVEEKAGEENRRRAARDIITTAIRTGKPPMPYGRSSSAGVASLVSPPASASAPAPATAPVTSPSAGPAPSRVFRTEAQHRVEDHRNRGVSVERIIPIHVAEESPTSPPQSPQTPTQPPTKPVPKPAQTPLRRLVSNESSASEACSSPGEPIKKSAREFIIPIAVEGKGYVTPRQRSLEPDAHAAPAARLPRPRRISSLVSGGESEEEDDTHMHRLRSSRAARAESVSSGEEDEEDEGFHLLTAENLFSTLLHRVRALTNRLNGEEGPGFPQHPHSLFNNLQTPFFNSREGWGARDLRENFDSMFNKPRQLPRGGRKRGGKEQAAEALDLSDLDLSSIRLSDKEMRALSGLTPALSRRLQRQLLASLPPAAARRLRRTLSLHDPAPASASAPAPASAPQTPAPRAPAPESPPTDEDAPMTPMKTDEPAPLVKSKSPSPRPAPPENSEPPSPRPEVEASLSSHRLRSPDRTTGDVDSVRQFCTLPRLRRRSSPVRDLAPPIEPEPVSTRIGSTVTPRITPDRPLLSKYLTPERASSLDDSYSSDGSILSEPSYVAAYGGTGLGLRRHSMRLTGDQPRRRVSRFLRSDFFDSPPDESVYAKHRKEKELETQKILREIREKKNRSLESPGVRSPTSDYGDAPPTFRDDPAFKKCLSPVSLLTNKERSRSNTPFFPILDNIKETAADAPHGNSPDRKMSGDAGELRSSSRFIDCSSTRESKLTRPKSYPVKNQESIEEPVSFITRNGPDKGHEIKDASLQKESKLTRPKSYPTSSPSPEKVYVNRNNNKKETASNSKLKDDQMKSDVEVSFSITLPMKKSETQKTEESIGSGESVKSKVESNFDNKKSTSDSLVLKKYKIINEENNDKLEPSKENGSIVANGIVKDNLNKDLIEVEDKTVKILNTSTKKEDAKAKATEGDSGEKKGTVKKKIIKKVSSKSKADVGSNQDSTDAKSVPEKKKVTKKVKEKVPEDGNKPTTVTKKKSMFQSLGHKLEKFTSAKSSSPEKSSENGNITTESSDALKLKRIQREQSVPVNPEPPTESNLIKRAVTLTDVAALDTPNTSNTKTTVSKVLGLFKKFDPKEKSVKSVEKSQSENLEENIADCKIQTNAELPLDILDKDKPRRPTSLLLNGLSRKNKYGRTTSDNVVPAAIENDERAEIKRDTEPKNLKNTLKLDFSKLPRVKKIVPTNPVIEPQVLKHSAEDKETEKKENIEKKISIAPERLVENNDMNIETRSRSRSRSTISNSELKSDLSVEDKSVGKHSLSPSDTTANNSLRGRGSVSPEKDDIIDRIRRKSFYSRFNEKKARRKSSLVGPGAAEYDPLARIHSPPVEMKYDASPTSPPLGVYDLSPGYSIASDLSPSTERYRSLLTDLPVNTRNNSRFENYGLNDKIDTYRSLDRNDFRKCPGSRSYLDYDQPLSYGGHRYSRTKSLLENSDGIEESTLGPLRDPQKYNRTLSMYSPGNYATYRPKRTRNSAIILKESEKEPSPENILEKIRNRKNISISVTRKPDIEKEKLPRSNVSPQSEGDRTERSEKTD